MEAKNTKPPKKKVSRVTIVAALPTASIDTVTPEGIQAYTYKNIPNAKIRELVLKNFKKFSIVLFNFLSNLMEIFHFPTFCANFTKV